MKRLVCLSTLVLLGFSPGLEAGTALAQTAPGTLAPIAPAASAPRARPRIRGRAYKLKIDSSPQQAVVYWDSSSTPAPRDYGIAGYTPLTLVVPRGNVRVVIELKGFRTQERDIDVTKPETLLVTMEKAALPARLEIVAGGDSGAVGADVSIDGVPRGTLPNSFEVPAGRHNVEVKKVGWKTQAKWIDLNDDERRTVEIVLERVDLSGALLVTADVPGDVYVDGVRKDVTPTMLPGLPAGEHIVEVRREGSPPWRQSVTIVAGQQAKVSASLGAPVAASPVSDNRGRGMLRVQSVVPEAEVFLDGSTLGKAPVDRHDLAAGKHYVIVRKEGYEEFKREVYLVDGQPVALVADLRNVGKVRFLSTPEGADVTVDGEPMGKTPVFREDIAAGEHVIAFRLNGFYDHKDTVTIVGGKERLISPDLKPLPNGPSPDQMTQRKTSMSSFGARVLPKGGFTADLGLGYPYILFARLTVGAFNVKPMGLDLGIELQSFFQMWTGALQARWQFAETGPLSVGIRGDAGGGAGSDGRNTIFFDLAALASLDFAGVVSFSVDLRLSAWSDQFCPSADQVSNGVSQQDYCKQSLGLYADKTKYPEFNGQDPGGKRFGGARLYTGLTVVGAIDRRLSFFARLEFLPGAGIVVFPTPRMAFLDRYNSVMFEHDPFYYGTVGLSLKF